MTWVVTAKTRFYLHDDETLLDGLIRTGHQVEFQCKEGYCGSCRVKVAHKTQPLVYSTPPLAALEPDEILPCCCHPQGVLYLKDVE